MAGTQGWTAETYEKISVAAKQRGNNGNLGRRGFTYEERSRAGKTNARKGTFVGKRNPNWRGGPLNPCGPGWKAARRAIWLRDKVCKICGKPPKPNRNLDVHHLISRRDGGSNDLNNLVGLHHGCHMKLHAGKVSLPDNA